MTWTRVAAAVLLLGPMAGPPILTGAPPASTPVKGGPPVGLGEQIDQAVEAALARDKLRPAALRTMPRSFAASPSTSPARCRRSSVPSPS